MRLAAESHDLLADLCAPSFKRLIYLMVRLEAESD